MHVPVLAAHVVDLLGIKPGGTYVDCTAGAGGHAVLIASRLESGRLIALDRDETAVAIARRALAGYAGAQVVHASYAMLCKVIAQCNIDKVDGILIDAGLSSMQLDDPARGFSFQTEGPLDMRMDASCGVMASQYLASVDPDTLACVLREYGDVIPARKLARVISERARHGDMETTNDLRGAILGALKGAGNAMDIARTVFQAVRIAVNRELEELESVLTQSIDLLNPGGRIVAISFHSGEDRIVKRILRDASRPRHVLHPDGRVAEKLPPKMRLLTTKPVTPDVDEIRANSRAHSARLRAAERLYEGSLA